MLDWPLDLLQANSLVSAHSYTLLLLWIKLYLSEDFSQMSFTKSDEDGHADDNVGSERRGSINNLQFPALRAPSSSSLS